MSSQTRLLERPPAPVEVQPPPLRRPDPSPAPRPSTPAARTKPRTSIRQLVVGLIALPLTALPFVAYATLTPEGRLIRDRVKVAMSPPTLPDLTPAQVAAAVAAAPRYEGAVMALAYHGIGSASDGEGGFVVSPERFGEHLATLRAAGMNTVTASEVAAAFAGGKPLPPNAVMLTFDDGRADAMMFADPLLKQAGMSATMFVIADAASQPGVYYASWEKIESYSRSGRWDIQSHTAGSHREQKAEGGGSLPMLTSRASGETLDEYRQRVRKDLDKASDAIEARLGRRPVAFAYPFGAYGADRTNDPAVRDVLAEEVRRQYGLAFHQDDQHTIPLLDAGHDRLGLRRLEVENWSGIQLLDHIRRAKDLAQGTSAGPAPAAVDDPPSSDSQPLTPIAATPAAAPPTTAASGAGTVPRSGAAPASSPAPAAVVIPPATSPRVTVTAPPPTAPPATFPPPGPVVTSPPTTRPPTTSPPTTAPPTTSPPTSPPTTTCKPAGSSGKCAPGLN